MSLDSILRSVGKNLFDKTIPYSNYSTDSETQYGTLRFYVGIGTPVTISFTAPTEAFTAKYMFVTFSHLAKSEQAAITKYQWLILNNEVVKTVWTNTSVDGYFSLAMTESTYNLIINNNIQIELGSTATSYEPYHQGPETIKIGDKEVLKVSYGSRNLWQTTNTTFPAALSYDSATQTYTMDAGTAGYKFVAHTLTNPIPVGTTVTISIMFQSGKGKSIAIGGYHRTGGISWQGYINIPSNTDMTGQTLTSTFTTTETVEEFIVFHNTGDNIEEPVVFKVQYELGNKATKYVPYSKEVVWTKAFATTDTLGNFELGKSVLA